MLRERERERERERGERENLCNVILAIVVFLASKIVHH